MRFSYRDCTLVAGDSEGVGMSVDSTDKTPTPNEDNDLTTPPTPREIVRASIIVLVTLAVVIAVLWLLVANLSNPFAIAALVILAGIPVSFVVRAILSD